MVIHPIIQEHFIALVLLCQQFKVEKLYAFGSVIDGRFNEEESDIDLQVILEEMPPLQKGETLIAL